MRFSGFLSYSRRDQAAARRLVRRLEAWRPPRKLRRQVGIDRIRIFRDVEDAELGELSDIIKGALTRSEYLVLLCSPAARASVYVGLEIETFAEVREPAAIIPVLVDGRPNTEVAADDPDQDQAFPDALLRHYQEPLAADLRPRAGDGWSARTRREREAFFQVVARLLGIPKSDELVRRDRLQRRLRAGVVVLLLMIAVAGGSWAWWDLRPKAGLDPLWWLKGLSLSSVESAALSRLEAGLSAEIPAKGPDDRLLVATWNIREFPKGPRSLTTRSEAALTHIAAVISRFDIVAVQEMRGQSALFDPARDALLRRLGRHWAYIGSGPTDGRLGNGERLGFFFDKRSVDHGGELDEIVLTPEVMKATGLSHQISRTPVVVAFDAADRRLWLANAHIYYGAQSGARRQTRTREFDTVMRYIRRAIVSSDDQGTRFMILGDLNFDRPDAPEVVIAREQGFFFPAGLLEAGTSPISEKPYDQIILSWDASVRVPRMTAGGAFRLYDHVYRLEDVADYAKQVRADVKTREGDELRDEDVLRAFRTRWRTYQISDHRPKWIELDLSGEW